MSDRADFPQYMTVVLSMLSLRGLSLKAFDILPEGGFGCKGVSSGQLSAIFTSLHHRSAGTFVVGNADMVATFATIVPELEPSAPRSALWCGNMRAFDGVFVVSETSRDLSPHGHQGILLRMLVSFISDWM